MADTSLEHPPLGAVALAIDKIHGASEAGLVEMRPEIVEFLELACDFLALQAAAISSYRTEGRAIVARPDPPVPPPERLVKDGSRYSWPLPGGAVIRFVMIMGLIFGFLGGLSWSLLLEG